MLRTVNKRLLLTVLLATSGTASAAASASASAAPLAANLPAGALLTLETRNAGPTLDRLLGLIGQVGSMAGQGDLSDMVDGAGSILKSAIGQEGTLGVFSVADPKGGYVPGLLAVSKLAPDSQDFFASLLSKKKGAKVGKYAFARQDGLYAGIGGGLVYLASDKALLMSYLGRLSGKAAPRLGNSAVYTAPQAAMGEQQLGLYVNFSASAKVIRGQLGKVFVPRLLSPIVDALDTLGQYASGFSATDAGLSASSAQAPNAAGKDKPLYAMLTHTTDFGVQNVIPASAESVAATACAPETNAYTARWLTRVDLFDPFGFLSDSQLADHLEKSSRYLGDECAQVTLAGSTVSKSLSATFQRVTDMELAQARMPEYADSVNTAIQDLNGNLTGLFGELYGSLGTGLGTGAASQMSRALEKSSQAQIDSLKKSLAKLKLVYAFKGDYLVTAFSQEALDAAMQEGDTLADDSAFKGADLPLTGVSGWSYGVALPEVKSSELLAALKASGQTAQAGLSPKELKPVADTVADLYNRYGGMTSQSSVEGGLILSKSSVRYEW
jgi:hypothetical protein